MLITPSALAALLKQTIPNKIATASKDELQSLWADSHGVCTSWAILVASKIARDPDDLTFADAGHHRMAFTTSGILTDSSSRIALQLQDGVTKKYGDITYLMKRTGQGQWDLSYTVRLENRQSQVTENRESRSCTAHHYVKTGKRRYEGVFAKLSQRTRLCACSGTLSFLR